MRSVPWGRLTWFTIVWAVVVGLAALVFLSNEVNGDSPTITVDVGMAQSKLAVMQTPGPWNGGKPWSGEEVDAASRREYQIFWPEAWTDAGPYAVFAVVTLLAGMGGIVLASYREPARPAHDHGEES